MRGTDWLPGYNWITFDCECVNGDRIIKVKAYPRVLSKDRDRFLCDDKSCSEGKIFFDYSLNIDEKRKRNLQGFLRRGLVFPAGCDKIGRRKRWFYADP